MITLDRKNLKNRILQQSNLLPILVWASLGLGTASLGLGFLNFISNLYIAGKDVPTLVQLQNGQSALVSPANSKFRSHTVIKSFVEESMAQLFTWNTVSQSNDGSRQLSDKGVSVGEGRKVPTRTWQASFSLSNDFRETFMQEMASSFIPAGVLAGEAQSALLVESLSDPKEIKAGIWEINMVAFIVIFDGRNPQGKATSFNKTIVVKAVEPSLDPLPEETTPIQKAVYQTRSKGLEIHEIYELGS
ncbi:MAG: hypothetical protein AB8B99_17660 [Phormidesmis sp.]